VALTSSPTGLTELIHLATRFDSAVANTGSDIPPDRVDDLFEPFQRLDRTAGRTGHHGLGLSIVRAIATAHDATIAAEPGPGGGLRIEVTFGAAVSVAEGGVARESLAQH